VSTTTTGGFSFEHNLYIQGRGFALLDTTVTDTITNTGDTPIALRFDSVIDPGHIASKGSNSGLYTFVQFRVTQDNRGLYSANGRDSLGQDALSQFPFAGFSKTSGSAAGQPYTAGDWSATALNLDLAVIAPGATSVVTYHTSTGAYDDNNNAAPCANLATCHGTQIAFGDPGKNGGTVGVPNIVKGNPGSPVIGFYVSPYMVPISIVPQGSPLPPAPPLLPVPNYTPVPEPLAAALFGMGALGIAVARRSR